MSPVSRHFSQQELNNFTERLRLAAQAGDTKEVEFFMSKFKNFGPEKTNELWRLVEEFRDAGYSTALEGMWQIDFERQPVPFKDWVEDPYYMGNLGEELWPIWKKELEYVCHPDRNIIEWYLTGAIGIGKTFVSLIAQIYRGPYYCSCLRNPQKYFGLATDSEIVFGLFNTILDNATQVDFNQIARFVKSSGYFRDVCPAVVRHGKAQIYWPSKEMTLRVGSSELHALGSNLFGYMIDEVNFMKKPETKREEEHQAQQIYHHTTRRMKSRFQQHGSCPGLACIASSRQAQTSFLEGLMKDNKTNLQAHVSDYALWDTKGRDRYSTKTFRVLIGNERRKSEVLDELDTSGGDPLYYERIEDKAKKLPEGCQMIEVPTDFYFDFMRDIDGSLRDIAGIPTFGVSPLIWRVESVRECTDKSRTHPFTLDDVPLSMDDPEANLLGLVQWGQITQIQGGTHIPLHHPSAMRFAHCDLGLTGDAASIAMGCAYDQYIITHHDPETGQVTETFRPKIWIDFMIRIIPVRGQQIDLTKIVAFLLNLRNWGFPLRRVTFDGFASEMAIQILRKADSTPERKRVHQKIPDPSIDLEADVLSVDKTDQPYRVLRDCLNAGAVSFYHYEIFEKEILALEHDPEAKSGKGNVDHPPGGSKDVSDAVCGVCYGVTTAKGGLPATPVPEGYGDRPPGEENVDVAVTNMILSDYPDRDRVQALMPPPKPEANPTHKLRSGRQNWMQEIEGFGKHRRTNPL
jgi:hypothetical protein